MGLKEDFFAWKEANPTASKKEKKAKLEEMISLQSNGMSSGERNIQRAKKMFADNPDFIRQVEAMEQSPEAFAHSLKPYGLRTAEATFPETMEAAKQGADFPIGSAIKDVAGYPLRYGEALLAKADPTRGPVDIQQRMGQAQTGEFISDAMRSPYNMMPVSRVGQGLVSLAKAPLQKAGAYFAQGAAESLPSALMEQSARMDQGKPFSASEFGTEVVAGGLLPIGGKIAKRGLIGRKDDIKKRSASELAKSALSALSGKSKELLSYVGADEGKTFAKGLIKKTDPTEKIQKIQNFHEKSEEITTGIVDYMENQFQSRFTEANPRVQQALGEMGEIDISDIVLDLNKKKRSILDPRDPLVKSKGVVPAGYSTGDEAIDVQLSNLDGMIDKLTGRSYGEQRFTIPADELYRIRKDIDKGIVFDKNKFSTGLQKDVYNIPVETRRKLAKKLEKAGARTSFPSDMKEFHSLLDVRDEISRKMGDGSNLDKTQRFLITLGNPNKLENRMLAKKVEKLLGKDMFEEAQIMKLSREYNDGLGVYNDINTGRSMLAPVLGEKLAGSTGATVGATLGSPMLAGPAMRGIEIGEETLDYMSPQVRNLMRSGQTEYIGE